MITSESRLIRLDDPRRFAPHAVGDSIVFYPTGTKTVQFCGRTIEAYTGVVADVGALVEGVRRHDRIYIHGGWYSPDHDRVPAVAMTSAKAVCFV
jgi:hypothetical protein